MTTSNDLKDAVQGSWHRFLDVYEPLRPELFRYLTRSPWDGEDLAQDALARAFVTLGCMNDAPPNPRAWLFRVASNLWIDRARRAGEEGAALPRGAALSTTVGAVKAALHRGRGKLTDPELPETRVPAPAALDAFCDAFPCARDKSSFACFASGAFTLTTKLPPSVSTPTLTQAPGSENGSFCSSISPLRPRRRRAR